MRHRVLLSLALLLAAPPLHAQQLAARHYDVSDGLGNNLVNAIFQDSRGYIWISTYDGVSRFDGHRFKTFTVRDGLPHAIAHGITEDGAGRVWIAFFREGLVRVGDGAGDDRFHRLAVARPGWSVTSLGTTGGGLLVAAAEDGVYRLNAVTGALDRLHAAPNDTLSINAVHRDRRGRLWIGLGRQLLMVEGDTRRVWTAADGVGTAPITGVTEDATGRIVVSNTRQLLELTDAAAWRVVLEAPAELELLGVHIDRAQHMWIGTSRGLFRRDAQGGLTRVPISGLDGRAKVQHEDRDGNLWVGTDRAGVFVIGAARVANLTTADGLPSPSVRRVVEGANGRIFLTTDGGFREIVDGRPAVVPGATALPSPVSRVLRDSRGDWWTGIGDAVRRTRGPEPRFDDGEVILGGLTGPEGAWFGAALAEDAKGRIWTTGPGNHIFSLTPAGGTFRIQRHQFADQPLSAGTIAIDARSNIWLGSYGRLSRVRADGTYGQVAAHADTAETLVRSLFIDSRGWLWVGQRYRGVSVTREPDAERPTFEHYSTANGLASDTVWAICEDRRGRMYFGTGRGLERLDTRTGAIRHYSPNDGLVGATVNHCVQDSSGRLWVATHQGVSSFDPGAVTESAPPTVYFTRLRINDEEVALGERGQSVLGGHVLPASSSGVIAEFVAPSAGRALRYTYFLEGADKGWSRPSDERSINLARLGSGHYRLLVRAVDAEGRVSGAPAALSFQVLRPLWMRWWFLGLAALAVAAAAMAWHRMRVRQILALEAVRQQVAMDLHDDIGAGLTQIAIVSELGRQDGGTSAAALAETATLARTLRESMSDIVWAIDPRKDRLTELVHRFRQVAYKLLERNGVRVDFTTPPEAQMLDVDLPPDRRKHLLLIFKEAASNIARHARASHVRIDVSCNAGELRLTIADDGAGFDAQTVETGHGLGSLRTRTAAMGGRLVLLSTRGSGTTIDVVVPR